MTNNNRANRRQRRAQIKATHGIEGLRAFRRLKKEKNDLVHAGFRVKWALEELAVAQKIGVVGNVRAWLHRRKLTKQFNAITSRLKVVLVTANLLLPQVAA